MLKHHGIFQSYFYFHLLGLDPKHAGAVPPPSPFRKDALFCERQDQNAFGADYNTMLLAAFALMVRRLMALPKRSIYLAMKVDASERD